MKREIVNFSKKISPGLSAPDGKFLAEMLYGMLASQSCLLTKISHALQEQEKKIYTVDRLSDHLKDGIDPIMLSNYLQLLQKMVPAEPVIHIDDSDVIKPEGYHFESLRIVRDGSKSTPDKSVYSKGYHVTEACVMTDSNHPVSVFSELHSSTEKGFTSINHITDAAIDRCIEIFKKATYVMDRAYDYNKIFLKLLEMGQDFVIRLTRKRKLFFHGKWVPATKLCAERKGKVKMDLFYKGEHTRLTFRTSKSSLLPQRKPSFLSWYTESQSTR